ncbi:MAG: hypothetical protein MPK62_03490 [Alphaproteobacteria bacterium]|nr:hypothetical protein [Alphaproteobacteria bacterium]MDA8030192.1 hypothetical protein [Alphaproteobacteria bacterium]
MMFENESGTYRRGLTLGLTMAEIFILIAFMLLLLLLALSFKSEENQEKLASVTAERDQARRLIPEKIERLARKNATLDAALQTAKEEASKNAELLKKERQKNEKAKQDINQLRADLYASKGIDPPCWYQVTERQGMRHEQAYYLMDIAVHSDRLQVALRPPRPGRAVDEGGKAVRTSYQQEYASLPLAPFQNAGDMSLAEFAEVAEPIRRMGKTEQIRDYPCVFHAAVWDMTEVAEKERWKKATNTIKGAFYTYEVQNDPWPHGE